MVSQLPPGFTIPTGVVPDGYLMGSTQIGLLFITSLNFVIVTTAYLRQIPSVRAWVERFFIAATTTTTANQKVSASRPSLNRRATSIRSNQQNKAGVSSGFESNLAKNTLYLISLSYCLQITTSNILGPRLTSDQCRILGKISFFLFCVQKVFLYLFLLFKARLVQLAMKPVPRWSNINLATLAGIGAVVSYPIAAVIEFNSRKIGILSNSCIYIVPDQFWVLFVVGAAHDFVLSAALLYQFVTPLQEHTRKMEDTSKSPLGGLKRDVATATHIHNFKKVVQINTWFGMFAAISTLVTFSVMSWIIHKKDLNLASGLLPLMTETDALVSTFSVFVITTQPLWFCWTKHRITDDVRDHDHDVEVDMAPSKEQSKRSSPADEPPGSVATDSKDPRASII